MPRDAKSLPAEWRHPSFSRNVNPLPPVGPQNPHWPDALLAYFCDSPYYDQESLTALLRKGVKLDRATESALLASRSGLFYQAGVIGEVMAVSAVRNIVDGASVHRCVEAYYTVIQGTIRPAPHLHDVCASVVSSVARSLTAALQCETADSLRVMEAGLEEGSGSGASQHAAKRRRIHPAQSVVRSVVGDAVLREETRIAREEAKREADARQQQQQLLQQQQSTEVVETMEKLAPSDVSFRDPQSRKELVFSVRGGKLIYTVEGEARPPVKKIHFDPVAGSLRFAEKRGARLPREAPAVLKSLLNGLAALCAQAGVSHDLPAS